MDSMERTDTGASESNLRLEGATLNPRLSPD
jgi:hypothetical protein